MSNEKDVKLSVYGADEKDATSSDAASSLLGKVDSLPTANPERIATSLTSAEGVKKIWPGEFSRLCSPTTFVRFCVRVRLASGLAVSREQAYEATTLDISKTCLSLGRGLWPGHGPCLHCADRAACWLPAAALPPTRVCAS